MKTTKKNIESKIKKLYDVDVELDKTEGFYYWCGKPACFLDETNTYVQYLSDMPFDRWIEDFQSKVEEFLKWSDYNSIKEAVDKTEWKLGV